MTVKIRMKKLGRKGRPFFRVCAVDSRTPRDGRVIEELGTYDPMVPETDARAILRAERINYWLGVGAQPSPKVAVLIRKYGSNGTHISKQLDAIERLGGRRSKAIEAARIAAAAVPKPVLTTPAAPPADSESAPSNDSEASAEATAESDESGDSAADES